MAAVCPECGSTDVHALLDLQQCLACGEHFDYETEEPPAPAPTKKGKKSG